MDDPKNALSPFGNVALAWHKTLVASIFNGLGLGTRSVESALWEFSGQFEGVSDLIPDRFVAQICVRGQSPQTIIGLYRYSWERFSYPEDHGGGGLQLLLRGHFLRIDGAKNDPRPSAHGNYATRVIKDDDTCDKFRADLWPDDWGGLEVDELREHTGPVQHMPPPHLHAERGSMIRGTS
ncbi:hypothetical protein CSPX01_11045 [Colletotrichum filicis]|nr:hypothetical protein CSPX01_11045 [Colletotrichum filicis]